MGRVAAMGTGRSDCDACFKFDPIINDGVMVPGHPPPMDAIGRNDDMNHLADPAPIELVANQPARRRRANTRLAAREHRRGTQLLAEALEHDQFSLIRTARLRLSDMDVVAEEVCLHWKRTGLSAAAALSASQDSAVTQRVGRWMLDRACVAAAEVVAGPVVSVSIAPTMLAGDLARDVAAALERSGLAPARLELRLSEAGLLEPSTEMLLCLSALRDQGVQLVLEDFGMRHGSLSLLRHLPLTALQLDPTLTHDLSPGGEDAAVVGALVAMAHALGLRVIAPGIDRPDQRAALWRLGVDEGMGRGGVDS